MSNASPWPAWPRPATTDPSAGAPPPAPPPSASPPSAPWWPPASAGSTRKVLDDLVAAGIAKHRGAALRWCVDLVQQNEEAWLARLKEALKSVQDAAANAPGTADGAT